MPPPRLLREQMADAAELTRRMLARRSRSSNTITASANKSPTAAPASREMLNGRK